MKERYIPLFKEQSATIPSPMLANTYKPGETRLPDKIVVQPKLDGIRALLNTKTGKLYSRDKIEIPMPHITKAVLEANITEVEWLDGELYQHGLNFGQILSLVRRQSPKIQFYIFDCISSHSFTERYKLLQRLSSKLNSKAFSLVASFEINSSDLNFYHEQFKAHKFEGTIIRIPDRNYEMTRTNSMYKHKDFIDEDYEITGFVQERSGVTTLGALEFKTSEGTKFTARPMGSDSLKKYIWDHQDEFIGKICTVRYQEKSPDGKVPRFPRAIVRFEQK